MNTAATPLVLSPSPSQEVTDPVGVAAPLSRSGGGFADSRGVVGGGEGTNAVGLRRGVQDRILRLAKEYSQESYDSNGSWGGGGWGSGGGGMSSYDSSSSDSDSEKREEAQMRAWGGGGGGGGGRGVGGRGKEVGGRGNHE